MQGDDGFHRPPKLKSGVRMLSDSCGRNAREGDSVAVGGDRHCPSRHHHRSFPFQPRRQEAEHQSRVRSRPEKLNAAMAAVKGKLAG